MTPDTLLRDSGRDAVRALRMFAGRPAFAATALVTLALGIGAPTAIFSVVRAVLLRPLPYLEPDRIVRFRIETRTPRGDFAFDALPVSSALEWVAASSTLSAVAVYNDAARTLMTADGPVRLTGLAASPDLFQLLGAAAASGRTFEAAAVDPHQVVLSHATWRRYFNGSSSTLGSVVTFDGVSHRVVGVMPEGFDFPSPETAFWVPVLLSSGGSRGMLLPAIGRMRPGTTVDAVIAEGERVLADAGSVEDQTLVVRTLQEQMVGSVQRVLWLFMAAVGLVSVIATVNISLLLLAQGAGRAREFSVRLALGAGRGRLGRQVAIEGLVLALLGGAAGLVFAAGFVRLLIRIAPPDVPRLDQTSFDPQVLAFTGGLVFVASVVFAVLSAGRIVVGDTLRALGGSDRESQLFSSRGSRRRLNGLAALELALALVLLVGAGLLLRSFVGLMLEDQGFDGRGALAAQVTLPSARYSTPEARMAFHERLLTRLHQVRGVKEAGLITAMPNRQPTGRFAYDPQAVPLLHDPFALKLAEVRMATEGFLGAMGIPLLAGRDLQASDAAGSEPVMVISEELAQVHFPDRSPLGQMLYSGSGNRRVVGVAGTVKPATAAGLQQDPSAYLPLRQNLDVFKQFATMSVVVRGPAPDRMAGDLRAIVRSLDPELALFNVRTLDAEVARLVAGPRFSATVLGLFAAVALVMAGVGVYGVATYATGRRTREIGVRVALGATRGQILRMILGDGVLMIAAGLVGGLVASAWLSQILTGLLHEVAPTDPVTLGAVAILLSLIGLGAVYLPAHRAARLSPLAALRED